MTRPLLALLAIAIVVGVTGVSFLVYVGTQPSPGNGTVHGVIVAGPATPICKVGQNFKVNMQGYTLAFVVHCSVGLCALRQTVSLATDGSFSVSIPAGVYDISIPNCPWLGCGHTFPITVSVGAGQSVNINADIDTGIR